MRSRIPASLVSLRTEEFRDQLIDFGRGVVVVHRCSDHRRKVALAGVDEGTRRRDDRDIDAGVAQRSVHGGEVGSFERERDDPAPLPTEIAHRGLRDVVGETATKCLGETLNSSGDGVEPMVERLLDGASEAEQCSMVALPLFEPPSCRIDLVVIRLQPLGRGVVEHDRLDRRQDRCPHIEEAGAPRPSEEFAASGGESIAAQLVDIEGDLTGRLAGIKEVGDPVLAGDRTDAGGRIDEAAIGWDVVERDQLDGADVGSSDAGLKCVEIDFSVVIGGNDLDLDAEPPGELEVGDEIRAVLGFGREDAVTRVRRVGR